MSGAPQRQQFASERTPLTSFAPAPPIVICVIASPTPKIVDRKKRVGDYEVDTIVGAARSQHILTLNDRKTGKVWLRKLQNTSASQE